MLYETTANFRFATAQVRSALAVNDAGTIMGGLKLRHAECLPRALCLSQLRTTPSSFFHLHRPFPYMYLLAVQQLPSYLTC